MDIITPEEKAMLQARLKALQENRPRISQRIAEARELGDLKENAEYHSARELQGLEEAEIRRLEDRLARAQVVAKTDQPDGVVFLGSVVTLRDTDGEDEVYRIVGEATNDPDLDYFEVTPSSPMGEALMKARVGDTVAVRGPRGTLKFEIVRVE